MQEVPGLTCCDLCCCGVGAAWSGELLKKGPGQYRVTGVTLAQQQFGDSQGPADSGIHPSKAPAAAAGGSSQRKRPRQQSSQQWRAPQRADSSQYQQQQQSGLAPFDDAGSDDGYVDVEGGLGSGAAGGNYPRGQSQPPSAFW